MKHFIPLLTLSLFALSCQQKKTDIPADIYTANVADIVAQHTLQTDLIEKSGTVLNPRSILKNGEIEYIPIDDWTSGFFPGSIWYTYEMTGDKKWEELANKYTLTLDSIKHLKWHHDVGFMIGCSYLTGYRISGRQEYKDVIVEAARSLSTRFRPNAGVIQSWDADRGWQAKRGWKCPVIIDNMMNLELLFEATRLSGDSAFHKIAVSHANMTLDNHFRNDYSTYHVIDYDPETGRVRNKHTAQGYAHESAWARGQAWGLYGFTVCYRYTKDKRYLKQAEKIAEFMFNHPTLPADKIPYWDYDAPNIPNEPRDVSAVTCSASALYEMYGIKKDESFKKLADELIATLSTPAYKAAPGTNGNFILMHSVGSIPHNSEVDVPLNYADYYFQEALIRKHKIEGNNPIYY
ncbi:MAG: glycoside hydrolase family 88 protein [Bacteroidales bacterium]